MFINANSQDKADQNMSNESQQALEEASYRDELAKLIEGATKSQKIFEQHIDLMHLAFEAKVKSKQECHADLQGKCGYSEDLATFLQRWNQKFPADKKPSTRKPAKAA